HVHEKVVLTKYTTAMSFEQEVSDALPDDFGLYGLAKAFNNPLEAFKLLDSNGNGKITKEDLQKLLERFGFNGFAAKITAKLLFNKLGSNKNGTN
ncbi:unnamed protein product, partial [Rotaria socialis]